MLNKIKKLKSNQEFMKYFSNTSWLFFDKIFKMGVGFFLIVYITRYLGPEKFGILSYAQSFVSIFMAFASLGISQVLIRDLVNYPNKKNNLLGTAFVLTFLSSSISIIFIFILESIWVNDELSKKIIFVLSFTIFFQNFNMLIDSYFQHKVMSKKIVISNTLGFIISSIVKFYLVYIEAKLIYFAFAFLFDTIVLSLIYFYIYNKEKEFITQWKFDIKIAKKFIKVSIPLMMVAVSAFIYTRIDQVMIKHMIDNEAVGNYAAAIKVSELFYFIPAIIVTSLFPKLVELKRVSEKKYFLLIEKMYRLVVWIAIPIALGLFIFRNLIIDILFGKQYTQASEILAILSWGIVFASIGAVFVKILYIEHYEKKYLYKSIFGVFVNIILNYFLIENYGVNGAAIATIITMISVNYMYDIFDKDIRRFYYLKFVCYIPKFNTKGLL